MTAHDHDPLQPHAHDPNPEPPGADPSFTLHRPGDRPVTLTPDALQDLRQTKVSGCYIVSTGHGISGPFTFGGVQLFDLVHKYVKGNWEQVEVISADGFGNRVHRHELENPSPVGPVLLATRIDEQPMTRSQGLVRLIVPSERDDALRQVKWVAHIKVRQEYD